MDAKHETIREQIKQVIGTGKSDLLEIGVSGGCGEGGGNRQYVSSSAQIVGLAPLHFLNEDDDGFCYLPSYCLNVEIVKVLTLPENYDVSGRVSSRMFVNCNFDEKLPNEKPECLQAHSGGVPAVCISADNENITIDDFFRIIDGERRGDKFYPFDVQGDADVIAGIKTDFYIRFHVYAQDGIYSIYGRINKARGDIEAWLLDLIRTFSSNIGIYGELKPHYRHKDENGKRLWTDRGLQSPSFYQIQECLHKKFMGEIEGVFNRHGISFEQEYGLRGQVSGFKQAVRHYGLVGAIYLYADWLWHMLSNRGKDR